MATHNEFGKKAEKLALELLVSKGYEILETNFTYQKAEVDIIARFNQTIIAVEVKARSSLFYGDPQSFVNKKKIKLMVKAMDFYLVDRAIDEETRFDIVAVFKDKEQYDIKHIEDAFYFF
ncbi:YraN family protein [Galbibacter mesophilus]|uniref:YraN family protein n=1 Tax=Galbibacter mesophilus TaxID=379069 RepID=UPI001920336D|nr:YraN family protein [Galbibacter mesophilus]MCM5662008.1 YraN family protein [Galbibacter mesophilus]